MVAPPGTGSKPPIPTPSSPSNTTCSLNISDSELLLHYVSSTAATFVRGGPNKPDDPIVRFWAHNAPRIGLSRHFVLHLSLAIAGFHLAHLRPGSPDRQRYESLAGEHLSTGVAEMAEALSKFEDDSHGPLYIGATLVCYCSFASGPTGRGDLLLCDVEEAGPARWLPLIHGLKCIRESANPEKLWSGPMAPLAPSGEPKPLTGPTFLRDGFPRVDWVEHFERLGNLVAETSGENHGVYSKSFSALRGIYAATYGDREGGYDGPPENQFVHGWLYRVENEYVSLLRGREPLALILLAHFALLLGTMDDWYLKGWVEHLLARTRDYVPESLSHWVRWPAEQAGMGWGEDEERT